MFIEGYSVEAQGERHVLRGKDICHVPVSRSNVKYYITSVEYAQTKCKDTKRAETKQRFHSLSCHTIAVILETRLDQRCLRRNQMLNQELPLRIRI